MADLIQIDNFINKYNDNLLSENSLLKNNPTVNFSSDTGSYSITNDNSYSKASNCIEFYEVQNVIRGSFATFDFGDALEYTVKKNANYIFQFSVYNKIVNSSVSLPMDFKLKLYVNGVLTETYTKNIDINALEELKYYTFAQSFELFENQIVNFAFELDAPSVGNPNPNFTFNVGGFKLEVDDKFTGLPTPYSLPNIIKTNVGIYDYDNTLGSQSFTGTPIKLLNNGLGVFTNKIYNIDGVPDLFNTTTNQFDFSDLSLGDVVVFRYDYIITTTAINQESRIYLNIGIGSGSPYSINQDTSSFKTVGIHNLSGTTSFIYMGNLDTLNFPSELYFTSDANATVELNGFVISVTKR